MTVPIWKRAAWNARVAARMPFEGRFPYRRPAAIERAQSRRLRRTVAHAYDHVPFYRETMRRLGLGPGDLRTAADLAKLPLIEREDIQRDPEYFRSEATPRESCVALSSSGSTDRPVTVYHDPASVLLRAADRQRPRRVIRKLTGKRLRYRQAELVPLGSSSEQIQNAIAGIKLVPWSLGVEQHFLDMFAPAAENVAKLNELKPDLIRGYGSAVEAVFAHARATGCEFRLPLAAGYGADSISDPMRRIIMEDLGVPLISIYSAIEIGQIGFECEEHRGFHLNVDICPLRLVTPDGDETPDGEAGEVAASSLINRGMVLLNYRLGDVASMIPGDCPCGRTLPMLSFIQGRTVEWLRTADGRVVHVQAIKLLFNWEPRIWRFQVVQESASNFRVALVIAPGSDRAHIQAQVQEKLAERLGEASTIAVDFVESLPRTAGGKIRTVIPLDEGSREPSPIESG